MPTTQQTIQDSQFYAEIALEVESELEKEVLAAHNLLKTLIQDRLKFKRNLEIQLLKERFKREQLIEKDLSKLKDKDLKKYLNEKKKREQSLLKDLLKFEQTEYRKQRQKEFEEKKQEFLKLAKEGGATFKTTLKAGAEAALAGVKVLGVGKELGKFISEPLKAAGKVIGSALNKGAESVNAAMTMYSGVYSTMNARLQGSSKSALSIFDTMNRNLSASPYIAYQDMLNNTSELINKGIGYNIEERAFLMTIKDKIADTFDVANGTLLLIIRIQQADSTRARMGMEASLTAFLNKNFQDSSYLSDVYDTVTDAVADSVVLLGTGGGAEYEYQMQKWLGSLYSMGLSNNTVTNLASAMNMLSTGDVEGLESSGMYRLLSIAATRSGVSYGDLLTQGVNANNVNALMSNIVGYWSEIAQNNNQVTRKKMGELFGLDMSDLVAIKNVDQDLLNTLVTTDMSYRSMETELSNQLSQVASRMHISELINNAYQNVVTGIGRNIANNPGMMATWLINDMIKDATGGINIPFITAMGSGIGLETDLNSIVQLGLVGAGTLGLIGNIIGGLGASGGLNLDAWGHSDTTTRGTGLGGVVSGVQGSTSRTTFVGNANSSDIYSSSLHSAYDNVDKTVTNEAQEESDKIKQSIIEHIDPNVEAILDLLRNVSTGSSLRVRVEDYGLTSPF